MAIKIDTEKTIIKMKPNDGFVVELELEDTDGNPLDVSSNDYILRYYVKSLLQITDVDNNNLYYGIAEKTSIPNVVLLNFDATKTNFPVNKKPHYLILQIANSKIGFSREFYYQVIVSQGGIRTIY